MYVDDNDNLASSSNVGTIRCGGFGGIVGRQNFWLSS